MTRVLSAVIALTLLLITLFLFNTEVPAGDLGLCLPSPNTWALPKSFGWLIGIILLFLAAIIVTETNKKYNFIPDSRSIIPSALLLLVACNCLSTYTLSTSTIILFINTLCLLIILSTYDERNATREFFTIASLLSIGSMFQYAFLVFVPAYILGGIALKSFRIKEFAAFIFGLIAPYWTAVGLGIISPANFQLPESFTVINAREVEDDIFYSLLSMGIMALIGMILALYNGVHLFSRNSRLRCMHLTINLLGVVALLASIFNFENFLAYFATIALWVSLEVASLVSFYELRHPRVAIAMLLLVFLPLYILAM